MRRYREIIIASLASLALAGCGGGSSGPAGSSDPLASGRAALNRVAAGKDPADTTTLQGILQQFQQALQQSPDSTEAHFGIALSLAGVAGNNLDGGPANGESSVAAPRVTGSPIGIGAPGSVGSGGISGPGDPNGGLPPPPASGDIPPAPSGHLLPVAPLPPVHRLTLLWNIDSSLANPYALLNMLAPVESLQYGLIPFYGYSQDGADVARRQKLLADLDTVEQHLQAVEAKPDFSTTLPDPNDPTKTLTVGLPEVYLFDAYVNSLRVQVALSLAYVRDPGGATIVPPPPSPGGGGPTGPPQPAIFTPNGTAGPGGGAGSNPGGGAVASPFLSLDANKDGKLTPNEYLPASPYLTLRDASYLATAQQALQATAEKELKGITGVLGRPADGGFLVPNSKEVQAVLAEVRDHVVPLVQQAAVGPVTIEVPHYQPLAYQGGAGAPLPASGSDKPGVFSLQPQPAPGGPVPTSPPVFAPEKLTVNIAAWFKSPPADLKAFAPTYTLSADGNPDPALTSYPDPTFGGLYPDGLPRDLRF